MAILANIQTTPPTDGVPYAAAYQMSSIEGSLNNQQVGSLLADAVGVPYEQAVVASVVLTVIGTISANATYVVLQTDLGDGVWIDVAWILWAGLSGSATFLLCGGVAGANAFQQSRAAGTSPGSNGSNQMPLGGRIRFVGKSVVTGTSPSPSPSPSPGPPAVAGVQATISYKLLGLR